MTLDEAILHAEERAKEDCSNCAKEHRQLAEWLKELKMLHNTNEINGMSTVKDLIDALKKYPQDMPVAVGFDPHDEIEIEIRTWTHDNYPYDKPDINYVGIY